MELGKAYFVTNHQLGAAKVLILDPQPANLRKGILVEVKQGELCAVTLEKPVWFPPGSQLVLWRHECEWKDLPKDQGGTR